MENWVTAITFTYPHEAHFAKAFLESQGFDVIIKDELTAQVNNFYSPAIGGVKLQVSSEVAAEVDKILRESGYIQDDEAIKQKETSARKLFPATYAKVCPYCQSDNVAKEKLPGYLAMISLFLLMIPAPFMRKRYHCFECGKGWKVSRRKH